MKKLLLILVIILSGLFGYGQKLDTAYVIDSITYLNEIEETTEKAENVSLLFTMKETGYLRIINGKDTADFKAVKNDGVVLYDNGVARKFMLMNVKTGKTVQFGIFQTLDNVITSFAFRMDASLTVFWMKKEKIENDYKNLED